QSQRAHQGALPGGILEVSLAHESGALELLGNLVDRHAFRDGHGDHLEIAGNQMMHHLGDPLTPAKFVVTRLDPAGGSREFPVHKHRGRTAHDTGSRKPPAYRMKRFPLLDGHDAWSGKGLRRIEPVVSDRAGDADCTDQHQRDDCGCYEFSHAGCVRIGPVTTIMTDFCALRAIPPGSELRRSHLSESFELSLRT